MSNTDPALKHNTENQMSNTDPTLKLWMNPSTFEGQAVLVSYKTPHEIWGKTVLQMTSNIKKCQVKHVHCICFLGICNRCIHRFDHHCIWTNNDVGGLNHGYFVLFLITMMFKCIWGCYLGIKSLVLHTQHNKLLEATVMTSGGEVKSVTLSILLQVTTYYKYSRTLLYLAIFLRNIQYLSYLE